MLKRRVTPGASGVGDWLVEQFYLLGLLLAIGVALFFVRRPIRQLFAFVVPPLGGRFRDLRKRGGNMAETLKPKPKHPSLRSGVVGWFHFRWRFWLSSFC